MSAIPYEDRKNDPDFPHIGFRVGRPLAERFWRMSAARNETPFATFTAAVEALAREMNAARTA